MLNQHVALNIYREWANRSPDTKLADIAAKYKVTDKTAVVVIHAEHPHTRHLTPLQAPRETRVLYQPVLNTEGAQLHYADNADHLQYIHTLDIPLSGEPFARACPECTEYHYWRKVYTRA